MYMEKEDRLMAILYLLVGYAFVYVFTGVCEAYALSLFTAFYTVVVLLYLRFREKRPSGESWFWLAVLLAMGIPFAFWSVFPVLQILGMITVAAYWTLSACGRLLDGRTSEWVFFDGWNAMAAVPFGNFGCQFRALLGTGASDGEERKGRGGLAVLLGFLLVIPVLVVILPLLSRADAGFEQLAGDLAHYMEQHFLSVFLRILLAIPVSCYLYGLIFGGISGRGTDRIRTGRLRGIGETMRILPDTAVCTALLILCGVYVLFMGIQGSYLFSAFAGNLPEDFTYAEYARRGFFELCQIGVWNLLLLGCASLFSRSRSTEHRGLCVVTVLLAMLNLLLILTAMSKLGMYICVYGLTVNRILPMVFMVWMALVFLLLILRQRKIFPMARICIMAGAVLFCLLCIFPVEHWVQMYNFHLGCPPL